MDGPRGTADLPAIPLVDATAGGPLAVAEAERARLEDLFRAGRAHYGPVFLRLGDGLTKRWLADCPTPYRADLDACAGALGAAGVYMLNLSYEWSCTTAAGAPPSGAGNRLLRTLDWPLDGLGRNVVVARMAGRAGDWLNVTWPGFVGAATAMAPGRFSAALNQPPMKRVTRSCWLDWAIERRHVWRRRLMPPTHLLRLAFETCRSFDEAKALLAETPLAVPAFFTLSGTQGHQGCVIERTETAAFVRDGDVRTGSVAVANHWVAAPLGGRMRGADSPGRLAQMAACRDGVEGGFGWVTPPILNPTTRMAVTANASAGTLEVRGYETDGLATGDFRLSP